MSNDIQIDFWPVTDDNGTSYEVRIDADVQDSSVTVEMSHTDLVQFRNMIHNLLLELNNKLGE